MAAREMIVTCPACRTRYVVADAELSRPAGRTVRCTNCGHTWRQEPAAGQQQAAEPMPPPAEAPPSIGVPPPAQAAPNPVPAPVPASPPGPVTSMRRPHRIAVAGLILLVVIAVAIFVVVVGRSWVTAAWPPAARLYAAIGLPPEAPTGALKIGKITPSRADDGLVIEGEIVNSGRAALAVPRLRVALQDGAGKEVQFKIVDPPKARLQPGEATHFRTPFEHASDAATGVVVTFAPS